MLEEGQIGIGHTPQELAWKYFDPTIWRDATDAILLVGEGHERDVCEVSGRG